MKKLFSSLLSFLIVCAVAAPAGYAAAKTSAKTVTSSKTTAKKTAAKTSAKASAKTSKAAAKTSAKTAKASAKAANSKQTAKTAKASAKNGKNAKTAAAGNSSNSSKPTIIVRNSKHRTITSAALRRKERRAMRTASYAPRYSAGELAGLGQTRDPLALRSNAALVFDTQKLEILFEKNSRVALPMASLTKLMTGLVVVEARQDMNEVLEITDEDVDKLKYTRSRLRVGTRMTRADLLHLALMSSENRAAAALGRNYPGGKPAFVRAMNLKAQMLGMNDTHYVDTSGLSSGNVASPRDLAKLVMAAAHYPVLREYSTDPHYSVDAGRYHLQYGNTNRLVHNSNWNIQLQKTGYISEAGQCLVMQAVIKGRPVVMVFMDSKGKGARIADAQRIRSWLANSDFPRSSSART